MHFPYGRDGKVATYGFGAQIGNGGLADIFEISCSDDGWSGAGKRLRLPCAHDDLLRFQREVRLTTQLNHPNIVKIRASGLNSAEPWYAMERAEMNFRALLAQKGHGEGMLPYVVEICRGVQHAHENGILHRDLKPENVLVYRDAIFGEYCAVSDFGLGKHFDLPTATLTVTQASIGTPAYMAPEQMISTRTVDRTADVYAIGKVLYEALTGEFPMHMDVGLLGPRYRHIVTRCTQHDSRQRYQSVTEVMAALDLASGSGQGFVQPLSLFETLRVRLESASPTRVNLAQLSELFVSRIDDEAFLYTALPQLNKQVLLYLFTHHGVETARAIEAYDELIKGSVSFDYCDVAANFYERVYGATADLAVRQRVLLRLPVLGQRHNRWHVGEVFGRLVASTTDEGLLMAVRDMLISDPDLKAWVSPYLKTVPDVIRNAL